MCTFDPKDYYNGDPINNAEYNAMVQELLSTLHFEEGSYVNTFTLPIDISKLSRDEQEDLIKNIREKYKTITSGSDADVITIAFTETDGARRRRSNQVQISVVLSDQIGAEAATEMTTLIQEAVAAGNFELTYKVNNIIQSTAVDSVEKAAPKPTCATTDTTTRAPDPSSCSKSYENEFWGTLAGLIAVSSVCVFQCVTSRGKSFSQASAMAHML